MSNLESLEKKINSELGTKIKDSKIKHSQIYVSIDPEDILDVTTLIKINISTKFKQLIDITTVDYPENKKRFKMIYLFLSHELNQRIILSFFINENQQIPSLTNIFPSANWMEREIFDMYGIKFTNHPDLRRILTDYEFEGYPLRKDFPLTGYNEVRYNEDEKKVVYEPVKLEQNYRNFDHESPWEGTKYIKDQTKK
ncbi:MAG TPA: NADH-quinone oxidoreductase subunit C [Candidatus Pelagibacter bacterium]|jgi:NADH-quinone oxidoreductase subunit C|nr:NADH-quinone oxidoreductase subunit C [Candidatus Pelagibacter bacterium]|tara:strand:- start:182 stop:772 length:591 start_codon:yes stop_codon:yes gene_type:complete